MITYSPSKSNGWYYERNAAIVEAYQRGEKVLHIAARMNLDVETIRQILRGYGVKRIRGWW